MPDDAVSSDSALACISETFLQLSGTAVLVYAYLPVVATRPVSEAGLHEVLILY